MTDDAGARPTLQVISGDATPEDIAAILAVVSARRLGGRAGRRVGEASAPLWSTPSRGHRGTCAVDGLREHGWRTSAWPR
ncbi:MAG TPA: acyl-CoA carboxylase subunit epsilon [Kineosporiaceae bacterium]